MLVRSRLYGLFRGNTAAFVVFLKFLSFDRNKSLKMPLRGRISNINGKETSKPI
nr:MAG TPA: hypothetical protein [Caudoviricetes sp.]